MASKRSSLGLSLMSDRKRLELQEMFDAFDTDKDGKVSPAELEQMLQSAGVAGGHEAVPSMLKSLRTDSEGNLTFEEFARLMRPTLSNPIRLTKKQQELKEAFDAFDQDRDGVINAKELHTMMQRLGDRVTEQEAEQMIHEADHDQDGVINFHEFSLMMGVKPPPDDHDNSSLSPTSPTTGRHRHSIREFFSKRLSLHHHHHSTSQQHQ